MTNSKTKTFDKRVVFQESTDQHARLINRLRYDDLTQADFFRLMISGYIRGDERIVNYIDESKPQSKARKLKSKKLTSMEQIYNFFQWLYSQNKKVSSGRNFSVVHDKYNKSLQKKLFKNSNLFKLRRSGN